MQTSGYDSALLRSVVLELIMCCQQSHKHHRAVFEKYKKHTYIRVSQFTKYKIEQPNFGSCFTQKNAPLFPQNRHGGGDIPKNTRQDDVRH